MLTYNIENLELKDSSVSDIIRYTISTLDEDKVELIDALEDGYATKLFALKDKYDQDLSAGKIKLRKTSSGRLVLNTNSLIAWIKKNDSHDILDNGSIVTERAGKIRHNRLTTISIPDDFHHIDKCSSFIRFPEILDELFFILLKELKIKEVQYFKEHDEYEVKKQKLLYFAEKYRTTFNYPVIFCSSGSLEIENDDEHRTRRHVSIQELDELIYKYEEVEDLIKRLSK